MELYIPLGRLGFHMFHPGLSIRLFHVLEILPEYCESCFLTVYGICNGSPLRSVKVESEPSYVKRLPGTGTCVRTSRPPQIWHHGNLRCGLCDNIRRIKRPRALGNYGQTLYQMLDFYTSSRRVEYTNVERNQTRQGPDRGKDDCISESFMSIHQIRHGEAGQGRQDRPRHVEEVGSDPAESQRLDDRRAPCRKATNAL